MKKILLTAIATICMITPSYSAADQSFSAHFETGIGQESQQSLWIPIEKLERYESELARLYSEKFDLNRQLQAEKEKMEIEVNRLNQQFRSKRATSQAERESLLAEINHHPRDYSFSVQLAQPAFVHIMTMIEGIQGVPSTPLATFYNTWNNNRDMFSLTEGATVSLDSSTVSELFALLASNAQQ